jgi:hypothetical protein
MDKILINSTTVFLVEEEEWLNSEPSGDYDHIILEITNVTKSSTLYKKRFGNYDDDKGYDKCKACIDMFVKMNKGQYKIKTVKKEINRLY